MTTKIMALADAFGNLTDFRLLPGQAHDLRGTAALIEGLSCEKLLADRAFDADWLRDALTGVNLPFAEIHISDVNAREEFRRFSYLHDVAAVRVIGQGVNGYASAIAQLTALIP